MVMSLAVQHWRHASGTRRCRRREHDGRTQRPHVVIQVEPQIFLVLHELVEFDEAEKVITIQRRNLRDHGDS
jgi:hypothetical protein